MRSTSLAERMVWLRTSSLVRFVQRHAAMKTSLNHWPVKKMDDIVTVSDSNLSLLKKK